MQIGAYPVGECVPVGCSQVDLKGVVLGEGPLMYMDHLPVLGGCG